MHGLLESIRGPWPWWVAGLAVGAAVPLLLLLANRHFGVSSSMRHLCAACLPSKPGYFRYDWRRDSWNLFLVAGVLLGGWIAQRFLEPTPAPAMPLELFSFEALATPRGLLMLVGGGFLVGFGARWANGCTSGHAIMGLSLRRPASLVAVIGFFAGGMSVAWFVLPRILP